MHRATVVAVCILVSALAIAATAAASNEPAGIVTAVDDAAKTFSCHWKTDDWTWTFKTNDKTTYWVGDKPGSWADVKVGVEVKVTSHDEAGAKVADKVRIKAAAKSM